MRRLEFLITEVRNSTDNTDVNGVKTPEIVSYFNAAQKHIETLIFKNNPYADFFKSQVILPSTQDGVYDLPSDCFSTNAISMVEGNYGGDMGINQGFSRIKPISESEVAYMFGYFTRDNKVIISGRNDIAQLSSIRITYFKQLPTLDVRQAKVVTVVPNTSIAVTPAPTDLYLQDDHCSTVNAQGNQVVKGIYFTNTSGTPLLTSTTAGVDNTQYIVAGANSCNKSLLPDVCETYLLDYVKQRIYTRNNYDDANKQMYFTEQQKQEIISIFSKNKKDDDTLPVTDVTYLNF
jgi:hypothetical protein